MLLQHKLLVAKPTLIDPMFSGKVIFIVRHDPKSGAEGFILNGPAIGKVGYGESEKIEEVPDTKEKVEAALKEGKMEAVQIQLGGPCKIGGLLMIHGYPDLVEKKEGTFELGSVLFDEQEDQSKIMDGVYYGGPDFLQRLSASGRDKERKFRIFTGMSGWSPGQLEREIEAGAWDVKDANAEIIFDDVALNKLAQEPEKHPTPPQTPLESLFRSMLKPSLN